MQQDPNELNDIATARPDVLAELKAAVLARWDPHAVATQVLASQARRKFINSLPDAMQPVWDYQASTDDTRRFVRRGRYKYVYTHGHPDLLFDMRRGRSTSREPSSSSARCERPCGCR